MNPVTWGLVAAAVAAVAWHAVTEHHLHRHLLRLIWHGAPVPATTHDTWWHSLPRRYRAAVQASLLAAGALMGVAYPLSPLVVNVTLALVTVVAFTGWALTRRRSRLAAADDGTGHGQAPA